MTPVMANLTLESMMRDIMSAERYSRRLVEFKHFSDADEAFAFLSAIQENAKSIEGYINKLRQLMPTK